MGSSALAAVTLLLYVGAFFVIFLGMRSVYRRWPALMKDTAYRVWTTGAAALVGMVLIDLGLFAMGKPPATIPTLISLFTWAVIFAIGGLYFKLRRR